VKAWMLLVTAIVEGLVPYCRGKNGGEVVVVKAFDVVGWCLNSGGINPVGGSMVVVIIN